MCLGVPARVLRVKEDLAVVDYGGGVIKEVDASIVPDIKPGDYVIVHAGIIIAKIDEEEAMEMIKALRELRALLDRL
ncbi:MAG: HypC/HybG/HupF family hydrogenase formation chaperone [Thermoprotei archaeon]|nr:MAG: HypC/HybG/HupF family hydrogenase formation chaperone [Thermoprotei archaeon]RLF24910.1 MAG: HypC/HybG/HupF family hydrogenase formation chaperone [Thermoprotei archaeon]